MLHTTSVMGSYAPAQADRQLCGVKPRTRTMEMASWLLTTSQRPSVAMMSSVSSPVRLSSSTSGSATTYFFSSRSPKARDTAGQHDNIEWGNQVAGAAQVFGNRSRSKQPVGGACSRAAELHAVPLSSSARARA